MQITIDNYELSSLIDKLSQKEDEYRTQLRRANDKIDRLEKELVDLDEEKCKFEVLANTLQGKVDALTEKLKRHEPALTKKEMAEDESI